MITQTIKPNVAIVTDVTHDTTTPMIDKKKEGHLEMGKGPVIAYAPAVQQKLRDLITDTAEAKKFLFNVLLYQELQEPIPMLLLIVMEVLLLH